MKPHRNPYTQLPEPWRWNSLCSEKEAHETERETSVGVDEGWGRGRVREGTAGEKLGGGRSLRPWVMLQERRGRPGREQGVGASKSKSRFQSKKKAFPNLETSPFLRCLRHLHFLRLRCIKKSLTVKTVMNGGIYQMFTRKLLLRKIWCEIVMLFTK